MNMSTGSDISPTLIEARADYFTRAGFAEDGGYNDAWVVIGVGPFNLRFPNTDGRRRAVPYHDLHHVLTGYATDLTGEAEISAWEIGSSCRGFFTAWIINLLVVGFLLPIAPRALFRAFVHGRNSRNLYTHEYDEALLNRTVDEMRQELGLTLAAPTASITDGLSFTLWALVALVLAWGPFIGAAAFAISWFG